MSGSGAGERKNVKFSEALLFKISTTKKRKTVEKGKWE
jgi:hypothetical protein